LNFPLPTTLRVILHHRSWINVRNKDKYSPLLDMHEYLDNNCVKSPDLNFIMVDCFSKGYSESLLKTLFDKLRNDQTAVVCLSSTNKNAVQSIRRMFVEMQNNGVDNPVVVICDSPDENLSQALIHFSVEAGALLLEGFGDGVWLSHDIPADYRAVNSIAFGVLQATRVRISKTEYISCPSCGRTLFDLQETTAKIRAVTNHLKGVKIAIMGCIVNGPGEMADADFGYVGSGPGKVTLYRGKEIIKRNVNSDVAVEELINLLKENDAWVEPKAVVT